MSAGPGRPAKLAGGATRFTTPWYSHAKLSDASLTTARISVALVALPAGTEFREQVTSAMVPILTCPSAEIRLVIMLVA